MTEPEFLTLAEVLEIHNAQIREFGGRPGLREPGLLASAVAMAQASYGGEYLHANLFEMAAAYAYHVSENQPFIDGNKRTGLAAALLFLELNGVSIRDPRGRLYSAMMGVAGKKLDKKGLAGFFEKLAGKRG